MPSSESEGQPPPKKRSRKTSTGGEESGAAGKKARGRPRVDTQDATAADRRRTQIRLAQRAYRQRKETTISSLKDQNTRLQGIIADMNKSFLQFNDSAVKSGLLHANPVLAHQLKQVMENFVALAKSASECEGEEDGVEPMRDVATEGQTASPEQETVQDRLPQNPPQPLQRFGWGYSEVPGELGLSTSVQHQRKSDPLFEQGAGEDSTLIRYRSPITSGHLMDQGGRAWNDPHPEEQHTSSQALPFGLVDILSSQQYSEPGTQPQIFPVNLPTPELTPPFPRLPTPPHLPSLSLKSPKPTWTYSHDETTFARRLTRAALETGFHLLSSANQRPAALNHVFKLSLPYSTLPQLRETFKRLLARGVDEDLDNWTTPFIHLGGAGTHYARKDANGNVVKIPNAWTIRRIGPITSNMIRAENVEDPTQSHELDIDLTGFEGEWFDAFDVEGYLEHVKGVRIDPKSSFAEVTIDDDTIPAAPTLIVEGKGDAEHLDYERTRRLVDSATPSFTTGTGSTSSSTTPTQIAAQANNPMESLFNQPDAPFGLDLGTGLHNFNAPTDFSKMPNIDPTTFFDQPLGLDLAPGFDLPFGIGSQSTLPQVNYENGGVDIGTLGLDLMGADSMQLPTVRQKRKKPALVDVSKLINGIIKYGVCLGRSPGFRRKDIDMAFEASLITSF